MLRDFATTAAETDKSPVRAARRYDKELKLIKNERTEVKKVTFTRDYKKTRTRPWIRTMDYSSRLAKKRPDLH